MKHHEVPKSTIIYCNYKAVYITERSKNWYFLNIHRTEKRFTPKLLHMKVIYTSISAIFCDDGFCESDKDRLNLA